MSNKTNYKEVVEELVKSNSDKLKLLIKESGHDGIEQFYSIHIYVDGYDLFVSKLFSHNKDYENIAYMKILYSMIFSGMDYNVAIHKKIINNRLERLNLK